MVSSESELSYWVGLDENAVAVAAAELSAGAVRVLADVEVLRREMRVLVAASEVALALVELVVAK